MISMTILLYTLAGFVLDLILGDPESFPHPVVGMGKMISFLEEHVRKAFPGTPRGLRLGGLILALTMLFSVQLLSLLLLFAAGRIHPYLAAALNILWCWQCLAMRCLAKESESVRRALEEDDLGKARLRVSRIVGRDTKDLDKEGVTRAVIETIAENFSDGEIAPLFYMLIGGAPLALAYKAVNTMDSMIGYKNEKYLDLGRAAAKLDDAANFIPARLSALLLTAAAFLSGEDGKNAFRIWRRDRRKHASPNSGQTEAAMAGALGVRLAGPASYFGKPLEKPYIGDPLRPVETADIRRAERLMYIGGFLALILLGGLRLALTLL